MSADVVDREKEIARDVASWLAGQRFGELEVAEVDVQRLLDAFDKQTWVFGVLRVASEASSWDLSNSLDVDDIFDLKLALRTRAIASGLTWPWRAEIVLQDDEEPNPDDARDTDDDS